MIVFEDRAREGERERKKMTGNWLIPLCTHKHNWLMIPSISNETQTLIDGNYNERVYLCLVLFGISFLLAKAILIQNYFSKTRIFDV